MMEVCCRRNCALSSFLPSAVPSSPSLAQSGIPSVNEKRNGGSRFQGCERLPYPREEEIKQRVPPLFGLH